LLNLVKTLISIDICCSITGRTTYFDESCAVENASHFHCYKVGKPQFVSCWPVMSCIHRIVFKMSYKIDQLEWYPCFSFVCLFCSLCKYGVEKGNQCSTESMTSDSYPEWLLVSEKYCYSIFYVDVLYKSIVDPDSWAFLRCGCHWFGSTLTEYKTGLTGFVCQFISLNVNDIQKTAPSKNVNKIIFW